MCTANIFLVLISLIFPPLAVWIKRGLCSADSLINIALCCLGVIPGILHSWYIIYATPDYYEYERVVDVEDGRHAGARGVSYYYVEAPRAKPPQPQSYGTVGSNSQARNVTQGGSNEVPPTYSEAIKGDNKVQRS